MISLDDTVIKPIPCYQINYHLYDNRAYLEEIGVENINQSYYDPAIGLKLRNLTSEGYVFDGWYDGQGSNAAQIKQIAIGETGDVDLYARWTPISFNITYINGADNSNVGTYTVESEISFTTPKWAGLEFSHWTDKNGNPVTGIDQGTIGNLTFEANWRYKKNLAVSNPDKYTYVGGALDSQSRYYFIYEIGTIENVVLDEIYGTKYDANTEFSYTETETYRVEKQEANTVAQTVANSVIKSKQWENTSNWVSNHEEGTNNGAKFCPEIEVAKVKVKVGELSAGWSEVDSDTYTETAVQMDSLVDGTEITNQTLSTISFVKETETSREVNMKLYPDTSPAGYYSYVRAADIKVYAIVTYDPANGEYYLDIYSMVYRVFDTTLFELVGNEQYKVNIESRNQLDFEIPHTQISKLFYTVQYDANGGSGSMHKSVHELGVSSTLLANGYTSADGEETYGYTKTGYTFAGWKTTADGSTAIYTDGDIIRDIANAGETVTLYTCTKFSKLLSGIISRPVKVCRAFSNTSTNTMLEEVGLSLFSKIY